MNNEVESQIIKRYDIKNRIGVGAYGIVWKAIDKKSGQHVALKKIFDAFKNETDAQRTFREIAFLQEFSEHPNIVQLINVRRAENDRDIYLVFELMESDLHNIIKRGNLLQSIHKQFVIYQILKALKYMHSGNVIHRDLKPSNVLLDSNCVVKLCDFGLTRSLQQLEPQHGRAGHPGSMDRGDPTLTEYVATRWYRAPEILLGSAHYSKAVDLWSTGCILAEMMLGRALFTGSSSLNQIEKIVSALPRPSEEDIRSIKSDYCSSILGQIIYKPGRKLDQIFPTTVDPLSFDLMLQLLQFNPQKRFTVQEALEHLYVEPFHDPEAEVVIDHEIVPPISDECQLTIDEYRQRLYDMIMQKKEERVQRKLVKENGSKMMEQMSSLEDRRQAGSNNNHHHNKSQSTKVNHSNNYITAEKNQVPRYEAQASHTRPISRRTHDLDVSHESIGAVRQSERRLDQTRTNLGFHTTTPEMPVTRAASRPGSAQHRRSVPPNSASLATTTTCAREVGNPVVLRDLSGSSSIAASGSRIQKMRSRPSPGGGGSGSGGGAPVRSSSATFGGRRQFDNAKNSSNAVSRATFGSYSQKFGTMSNSKLQDLYSKNYAL